MKINDEPRVNRKDYGTLLPISPGFALIDLLAVIAVMAVLGALLLPGLASGTQQAGSVQCLNSLRQLSDAWAFYSGDNNGKLVGTGGEGAQPGSPTDPNSKPGGRLAQWCPGQQQLAPGFLSPVNFPATEQNLGLEWIKDGLIYPYVRNTQAYLCPADESYDLSGGMVYPHVRSRSMNVWFNPINGSQWNNKMRIFYKESDLTVPGPANTFSLIDENPQSINDGTMIEDPSYPTLAKPTWIDGPANYHSGAAGISFCDGHAALKKWRDPVVLNVTAMQDTQNWNGLNSQYEPDVFWLVNRSTALPTTTAFLGPQ